jgi:uncharacterized membrane protein
MFALRAALLLMYLPLAHYAGVRSSPVLAAVALFDLALLVLLEGLWARRARAWLGLCAAVAAVAGLYTADWALIPLLLMPAVFLALVAAWFGRSLGRGREPLIVRIMTAIYAQSGAALSPQHRAYGRRLTALWAGLLGGLAAVNLVLALIAVPDGVLAQSGVAAPVSVTQAQWSLFANALNYGVVGAVLLLEFQWRKRVFPQRPYRNMLDFARRMAALGPVFWRDLFR